MTNFGSIRKLAAAVLATASIGQPAQPSGPPSSTDAQCELHIWGTENINAVNRDDSLSVDRSLTYTFWRELPLQERLVDVLSIAAQREILEGSELQTHPALGRRTLIWHDEPSTRLDWDKQKKLGDVGRLAVSNSSCYTELHFGYITFLDQPGKDVLQTGWALRHFGDADMPAQWGWDGGYEKTEREYWTGEVTRAEVKAEVSANIRANFSKFLSRRRIKRVLRAMIADEI